MWNHRLVIDHTENPTVVAVAKVFYDPDRLPWGYARAKAYFCGCAGEGEDPSRSIAEQLQGMLQATNKPILNYPADFIGTLPDFEQTSASSQGLRLHPKNQVSGRGPGVDSTMEPVQPNDPGGVVSPSRQSIAPHYLPSRIKLAGGSVVEVLDSLREDRFDRFGGYQL